MYKILIMVAAAALCACGNVPKKITTEKVVVDMHNAENALDFIGTYNGTLPAADCPGIETTIELSKDGSYKLIKKYIGRATSTENVGKYELEGNLLSLVGHEETTYYKVEENRLRMLNADKREVESELAPYYVLTKTN